MIEKTMYAVRLHTLGDPGALVYEQIDVPRPAMGEALVSVHAAAITRDELDWPEDRLPATPSYEFSGIVVATGPDVAGTAVGDAVYALSGFDRDGAAAQYVSVPHGVLAPKPRTLGHVESAAIPLAALSAWQGLFEHGKLTHGQRVLIHGGAGGVGAFAVQLARARGAQVIATTSTANAQAAHELGAHEVIDHSTTPFEDHIEPVDLVFDTTGGERLQRSPHVLRAGGGLVSIAAQPPRSRTDVSTIYFVVEPNREQLIELGRLADNGQLRPIIDQVFPLADAREAFQRTTRKNRRGKIVLRVADEPQT